MLVSNCLVWTTLSEDKKTLSLLGRVLLEKGFLTTDQKGEILDWIKSEADKDNLSPEEREKFNKEFLEVKELWGL